MKRRLTRACYEARAWLTGVGESRDEDDPLGKMALSLRNLSGQELLEARDALEDLLNEEAEAEDDEDDED